MYPYLEIESSTAVKELTAEQFDAISNGWGLDPNSEEEVDWKYEELDNTPSKHDMSVVTFVFTDPSTSKIYRGYYSRSYNEGISSYDFPLILEEVEKYEKTVIKYRKVK